MNGIPIETGHQAVFLSRLQFRDAQRKKIRKFMLEEPDIRTLDLGCGNGFFTAMAVRRGGTALAVSFDPEQISRCNQFKPYLGEAADRIEFRVMNANSLLAMEEKFDQILFLEVIEHIDNDEEVMRNIARLLKPGGIVHISTPDVRGGHITGFLDRHATGGHVRIGYSMQRLEQVVRGAGLDVVQQRKLGGWGLYLYPIQDAICMGLGGGLGVQAAAFLMVYPFFLLANLIPIPDSLKLIQYTIARKRITESAPA